MAAATVSRIATSVGAPVGSVYHRFASRDVLMAELWLRTITRFQDGYLAALSCPGPGRGRRLGRPARPPLVA